jgi:hypothetical protein
MWHEAKVMFSTMRKLMRDHAVPSLSVHDSLIVPVSKAELAKTVLRETFWSYLDATPQLKINWPKTSPKASGEQEADRRRQEAT